MGSTPIQKPAFNKLVLRKWRGLLKLQHILLKAGFPLLLVSMIQKFHKSPNFTFFQVRWLVNWVWNFRVDHILWGNHFGNIFKNSKNHFFQISKFLEKFYSLQSLEIISNHIWIHFGGLKPKHPTGSWTNLLFWKFSNFSIFWGG